MLQAIQIISILLVALAMVPAVAHLLEFPGKKRLGKDAYLTVQPIYYPGFTIAGGIGEVGGLVFVVVTLLLTPPGTPQFWLTLAAVLGMLGMQIIFWLFTQPVNKFWLQSTTLGSFGGVFFSVGAAHDRDPGEPEDWKEIRDRWEYSHIARAGFAVLSFLLLVVAAVTQAE
jgi:hypothetical protein